MNLLKKLFFILSSQERKKSSYLLLLITIMTLIDTIGVASILPFMTIIVNPEIIETNKVLNYIYMFTKNYGIQNYNQFIFFLGFGVFIFLVFSMLLKIFTTFLQIKFIQMREFTIGKRLIEAYLEQPYSWFLFQNSTDLGKNILSEVQQMVVSLIRPLIYLIANCLIVIFIASLLIAVNSKIAFFAILVFSFFYISIYYYVNKKLKKLGNERFKNNQLRFLTVNEVFSAIKLVRLRNLEQNYIENFSVYSKDFAKTQAYTQTISQTPRFLLEILIFGIILLVTLYSFAQQGSLSPIIPILSLYALAGYRLVPALQQIYSSKVQITFIAPALDKIYFSLKKLKKNKKKKDKKILPFKKSIYLKNISFNYPNSNKILFKNFNLKINAQSKVGLVGATGCGKTTLIDIILGLLEVQKGSLEVDGEIITSHNLKSWQSIIGYVPQNIYLSDSTVANNIAFGLEPKNINFERVREVAKIANIDTFVIEELSNKYDTFIGEQGVRLSGGQRQRIGIARALYHNPKILICDEATSALDNETEKAITDALNNLNNSITFIIVAHRINTLKNCDVIYEVSSRNIKDVTSKLLDI